MDFDHQQIWTKKSFEYTLKNAGLQIQKFVRLSEYTQPPKFYLDNMGISNPIIRLAGTIFYRLSPLIAKNKIIATLVTQN